MENKIDFKIRAKKHLVAAKEELSSENEERLKYAALEIRMAMEAVTYQRAQLYKYEIPEKLYETWQPRKLMSYLLEVDPYADQTATLYIGVEEEYGVPAKEMKALGTEHILSLAEIKKNYDALGSYLHMPTYKQLTSQDQGTSNLKSRCEELIEKLDKVANSNIFNMKFNVMSEINCMRCNKPIKKNVAHLKNLKRMNAQCFECNAPYVLEGDSNNEVQWIAKKSVFNCLNKSCSQENSVWDDELKFGKIIPCKACSANNEVAYSIILRTEK